MTAVWAARLAMSAALLSCSRACCLGPRFWTRASTWRASCSARPACVSSSAALFCFSMIAALRAGRSHASSDIPQPFAFTSSMLTLQTGHTRIRPCAISISPRLASDRTRWASSRFSPASPFNSCCLATRAALSSLIARSRAKMDATSGSLGKSVRIASAKPASASEIRPFRSMASSKPTSSLTFSTDLTSFIPSVYRCSWYARRRRSSSAFATSSRSRVAAERSSGSRARSASRTIVSLDVSPRTWARERDWVCDERHARTSAKRHS